MGTGLFWRNLCERFFGRMKKWPPRSRQDKLIDKAPIGDRQTGARFRETLKDRIVLTVYRNDFCVILFCCFNKELTGHNQGFFIGEQHTFAG